MARLEAMRETFAGRVDFTYVYIKEAHPEDEWVDPENRQHGIVFTQPQSFSERLKLAQTFVATMGVETRTLVDDMGDSANACYAAWPERLYLIERDGTIAYKGGIGPFFFDPDQLEALLSERYG